jgi:hypothetical protein
MGTSATTPANSFSYLMYTDIREESALKHPVVKKS